MRFMEVKPKINSLSFQKRCFLATQSHRGPGGKLIKESAKTHSRSSNSKGVKSEKSERRQIGFKAQLCQFVACKLNKMS